MRAEINMRVSVLYVLFWLVYSGGERGRGRGRGKSWHVAGGEEDCGQSTQFNNFHAARPASLCSISQTASTKRFCVCVTRDNPANVHAQWKFKCGLCELRWKPSFNKAYRLREKNIQQQRNKDRFERMRKTRRKLKREEKHKQRKQKKKEVKYLHNLKI